MKKRSSSQKSPKPTVKNKGTKERVTIGMDLGDKTSRYCMLSHEGEILREGQVTTTKAGMVEAFGALGPARIAIEVGTDSPWVSGLLRSLGRELISSPKVREKTTAWTPKPWRAWLESIPRCSGRSSIEARKHKRR